MNDSKIEIDLYSQWKSVGWCLHFIANQKIYFYVGQAVDPKFQHFFSRLFYFTFFFLSFNAYKRLCIMCTYIHTVCVKASVSVTDTRRPQPSGAYIQSFTLNLCKASWWIFFNIFFGYCSVTLSREICCKSKVLHSLANKYILCRRFKRTHMHIPKCVLPLCDSLSPCWWQWTIYFMQIFIIEQSTHVQCVHDGDKNCEKKTKHETSCSRYQHVKIN